MKKAVNLLYSVKVLLRHPIRFGLAVVSISISIAAAAAIASIGEGAQERFQVALERMGKNLLSVNSNTISTRKDQGSIGSIHRNLTLTDVELIQKEVSDINYVVPIKTGTKQVKYENLYTFASVIGSTQDYINVRNRKVSQGSLFEDYDIINHHRVALIGADIKKHLFKEKKPIGETIFIGKVPFNIVGVLEEKGLSPEGTNEDALVFIPVTTALRRVFNHNYLERIEIQTTSIESMDRVTNNIEFNLRQSHRLNKTELPNDFSILNQVKVLKSQVESADKFSTLTKLLIIFSLIIGGAGIYGLMILTVKERTNEIGLRVAIGARTQDVFIQFLQEAIIIGFLGGILGCFITLLSIPLISYFSNWEVSMSWGTVVIPFLFSVVEGALFGCYPALKASRIDPICALQSE